MNPFNTNKVLAVSTINCFRYINMALVVLKNNFNQNSSEQAHHLQRLLD